MSDALLPCPFCGGEAVLTNVRMSDHTFYVGCYGDTCGIRPRSDQFGDRKDAVTAWNRRAQSDAPAPLPADAPTEDDLRAYRDQLRAKPAAPARDALVAALRRVLERRNDGWALDDIGAQAIGEAAAALAQRDVPRAERWISIADQMPSDDRWVLVTNGSWRGVGRYARDDHLEQSERWQDEHREFIEHLGSTVTHWMPLPASPTDAAPQERSDDAREDRQ